MEGDVLGDVATLNRRRRLEPEDLLDGVRDQREVRGELGALLRVPVEQVDRPPEVPGHRFGPGGEQHGHELGELRIGESSGIAVVVDDLGAEQVGEHVVARVLLPVLELVREVPVHVDERLRRHVVDHADGAFLDVEDVVDDTAQVVAVLLGDAQEHRDHRGREDRREVLHVVELRLAHVRVEEVGADLADAVLERRHATVNARDTSFRSMVCLGGSVQTIIPVSTGASAIVSTVVPCPETNVS